MNPKVIILYNGKEKLIGQDYDNYEVIGEESQNIHVPTFYNKYLSDYPDDNIIGFMDNNTQFAHKNVISTIIEKLISDPLIGYIYADIMIIDKYTNLQYYPSFHISLSQGKILILSPIFAKAKLLRKYRFIEDLKTLYTYLFVLQISRNVLGSHIPSHLFYYYNRYDNLTVHSDYSYIQQWLTQQEIS